MKKEVLDPQGKVVGQTLKNMGYKNIINVRQGKYFDIEIEETDKEKAKKIVEEISSKLLTNIVIEDYKINLETDIKKNVKNNCQKQRETSILIIEGVMMILVFETVNYYALNAIVQRQRLRHVNQKDDLRLARQRNVTKH